MSLKPFWNKKYHTRLPKNDLDRLLSFDYYAGRSSGKDTNLASILINNNQPDSTIAFHFEKGNTRLFCDRVDGDGWALFDPYYIPITPEEAQTLLTTGELSQTIDTIEYAMLMSPLILKTFLGFVGSLQSVKDSSYCSGVVYDHRLTKKLYFIYITVTDNTATWKLIPIT